MKLASRAGLAALGVLAAGLPLGAAAYVAARTDRLAAALSDGLGVAVSIGQVDVDPTGVVRLEHVAVGELFRADSVEAAVAFGSLLSGHLTADEIRVRRPRLSLELDAQGRPAAAAVLARAQARLRRSPGAGHGGGPRRILVEDGQLVVALPGGTLTAEAVELSPRPGGARIVSGPLSIELAHGGHQARARFRRAAVDLDLPSLAAPRLALAGGALVVRGESGPALELEPVTVTRGVTGAALHLAATGPGGAAIELDVRREAPGLAAALVATELPLATLGSLGPVGLDLAAARFTGTARVALGPATAVEVDGHLAAVTIDHPLIDDLPVPIAAEVSARASVRRAGPRLAVALDALALAVGPIRLTGRGHAELQPGHALPLRAELEAELAPMPCAALPAALPGQLGAALRGLAATGELGGRASLAYDLSEPAATRLELDVAVDRCRILAEPPLADVRRVLTPFEHRRPDGELMRVGDGAGHVELGRLHRYTVGAFVAAEDARFFSHHGFDLEQIERSLAIDLSERRLARGGSTISQQLVKNVFVGPERTLARKLTEAIVTWRLESVVAKKVILERYLELIELGDGVYGLEAAARHYFGKSAVDLSIAESAFLAALTPAPRTLSRRLREAGQVDPDMARRTGVVLRAMRGAGVIDRASYARAAAERLVLDRPALARAERR